MNLKNLKMHLGVLTLTHLEEAGFVCTEDETTQDGVIIRVTPDDYNKRFKEVMWASSVNNDQGRFAMLMHAMLYDKQTAKEMGKPAEVAQVIMNKEKAAMILDTIRHAFPELMDEIKEVPVGGEHIQEDEEGVDLFEEPDEDEDENGCDEDSCISCGGPLDDEDMECGEPTPPAQMPDVLTADDIIDAHLAVKSEISRICKDVEIKTSKVGEPYHYMFAASQPGCLVLSFDELDVVHQVKEAVNPPILIKEDTAKILYEALTNSFPKLNEKTDDSSRTN